VVDVGLDELIASRACCGDGNDGWSGKEMGIENVDENVEEVWLSSEGKTLGGPTERSSTV
jgi:hypothetical protein